MEVYIVCESGPFRNPNNIFVICFSFTSDPSFDVSDSLFYVCSVEDFIGTNTFAAPFMFFHTVDHVVI